jgi:hypothetical protein
VEPVQKATNLNICPRDHYFVGEFNIFAMILSELIKEENQNQSKTPKLKIGHNLYQNPCQSDIHLEIFTKGCTYKTCQ